MKLARLFIPLLPILLLTSCVSAKKDNTEAWNKLQGRWKIERALKAGKPVNMGVAYAEIRGDEMDRITTERVFRQRIRINANAEPSSVDFEILDDTDRGQILLGIFKFDNEKLWFCHGPIGKPRPTTFVSTPDDGNVIVVMRTLEQQDKP